MDTQHRQEQEKSTKGMRIDQAVAVSVYIKRANRLSLQLRAHAAGAHSFPFPLPLAHSTCSRASFARTDQTVTVFITWQRGHCTPDSWCAHHALQPERAVLAPISGPSPSTPPLILPPLNPGETPSPTHLPVTGGESPLPPPNQPLPRHTTHE